VTRVDPWRAGAAALCCLSACMMIVLVAWLGQHAAEIVVWVVAACSSPGMIPVTVAAFLAACAWADGERGRAVGLFGVGLVAAFAVNGAFDALVGGAL
jgi:ATP/ADP translocase